MGGQNFSHISTSRPIGSAPSKADSPFRSLGRSGSSDPAAFSVPTWRPRACGLERAARAFFTHPNAVEICAIWLFVILMLALFWVHGFPWLARVVGHALGWS